MQNPNTIHANQALAADTDTVYAPSRFEHMFDMTGKAARDEQQVQAETTPHPLTKMALAGAGNPTSTEDLPMTLSMLKQQYTDVITSNPSLLNSEDERATAALLCARHALAHLTEPFDDLSVDDRYDIIFEWFHCTGGDTRTEEFWTLLSNLLYRYAGHMMHTDWQPEAGFVTDEDALVAMPVWRTESGYYGSDLLVFMTPWDTDEDIWSQVGPAMRSACEEFGDRFIGIRVVPPLARYLTRHYYPDGSWEPWYGDVPSLTDLIDEALASGDAS